MNVSFEDATRSGADESRLDQASALEQYVA
jgi:hypothetical protein